MAVFNETLDELWARPGVLESALGELGAKPDWRGRYWRVFCPRCGKREAFVYPATNGPPVFECNRRNVCAFSAPVFSELAALCGGKREAFDRLRAFAAGCLPVEALYRPSFEPARLRPPRNEIEALFAACSPVTRDPAVSAWLRGARGIDPERVAERDLARALLLNSPVPAWAHFRGRPWHETTHRLIVPLYGPNGELESVHARAVAPQVADAKAVFPAGYAVAGLVMADNLARRLLAHKHIRTRRVLIGEGLTDYLAWSTRWNGDDAPAVLSIIAGSWTRQIEECVPDGSVVAVETDCDVAGDAYAAHIISTLAHRCTVLPRRKRET